MSRLMRALPAIGFAAAIVIAAAMLGCAGAVAKVSRLPADVQATYDRQPLLLDRALADLQSDATARPQLYFVGFAGFGGQAVFKREVLAVRALFEQRFGTKGRSLALINHKSTLAEIPLASVANLERALRHVGNTMDRDRDTLFLFLTSHGNKGVLAVDMPRFGLKQLTPDALKAMLDRAGIKNRIIVVSACHSGSFIPALAGPTTLVIAAARADRTSFGCEDRRRWTYFGDAYFNRALRQEGSWTAAFARAKRQISLWERTEGLVPSLPQIAGGEALPITDWTGGAATDRSATPLSTPLARPGQVR